MPPEMVDGRISMAHLRELAEGMFGGLVKAVVDVKRATMCVGGEMHSDEEALMIEAGSRQEDLWGINLYPDNAGTEHFIEFDSMINIRPRSGNRSRYVEDESVRREIVALVEALVQ